MTTAAQQARYRDRLARGVRAVTIEVPREFPDDELPKLEALAGQITRQRWLDMVADLKARGWLS